MTTTPENDARLGELLDLGTRLVAEIELFTKDGGQQFVTLAHRARSNRRMIIVLSVSLALDLILTGVMAVLGIQVAHNEQNITALTNRLDTAQTTLRRNAFCPLYQVFLDQKSAAGRAAAPDPEKYDQQFAVIQNGYDSLGCSQFVSGQ